ncbi:MAG: hypothetical protein WC371_05615 [Parachlamydiales bacterium]|jgi:hypothetical protein
MVKFFAINNQKPLLPVYAFEDRVVAKRTRLGCLTVHFRLVFNAQVTRFSCSREKITVQQISSRLIGCIVTKKFNRHIIKRSYRGREITPLELLGIVAEMDFIRRNPQARIDLE